MAIVPEFISVLRNIRDTLYPSIVTKEATVVSAEANVVTIEDNVEAIQEDVTRKNQELKEISVVTPVTTVPNKPNGDTGDANVIYNATTNQFTFDVPVGPKGESMRIDYTVATANDLLALTVNTGDIAFVEDESSNYVKVATGNNADLVLDWSDPIAITQTTDFDGLTDTPSGKTGSAGKVLTVNNAETEIVFAGRKELGIVGYNYVENKIFDKAINESPLISKTVFGTAREGYGNFSTLSGSPSLSSGYMTIINGTSASDVNNFTKSKSYIEAKLKFNSLVDGATIVDCGNMKLFISSNGYVAVTDGTTTNELTALTLNTTDDYMFFATEKELIAINLTASVMYSNSVLLTITASTSGQIDVGGLGLEASIYDVNVGDRTNFTQIDGLYYEFAKGWRKESIGGDLLVDVNTNSIYNDLDILSGGDATENKIRFDLGKGGQFQGQKITLSFTSTSNGVGSNTITLDFVTDRGSSINTNRVITQNLGTMLLDNGVTKQYSATYDIDLLTDTYMAEDSLDYVEVTLPSSVEFKINITEPKVELGEQVTEFVPTSRFSDNYTKEEIESFPITMTNKTLNDITNFIGANHIHYKVKATEDLVKGDLVKVTGYNAGEDATEVAKVTATTDVVFGIVENDMLNETFDKITQNGTVDGLDTSLYPENTILYSNGTGGFTDVQPTTGYYQALALVLKSNANVGAVYFVASEPVRSNGQLLEDLRTNTDFVKSNCIAWVSSTDTGTIESSYGVASVTNDATGEYTINYIDQVNTTSVSVNGNSIVSDGSRRQVVATGRTSTSVSIMIRNGSGTAINSYFSLQIFGGQ